MCKLLIMTGITEGRVAEEFMRRMAVPMSKTNNHGIGYAAVAGDGELFSERWLINEQFMTTENVMVPAIAEELQAYVKRLPEGALETNYSTLGTINFDDVRSVTMHTRFATCGRQFMNTHPFIYNDTSLIHNGVISNAFSSGHYYKGLDVNKISTCDSEAALQTYLSQGIDHDTTKAKEWLDMLSGGYAFGILARNQQGNRVLDVVRGTSRLYCMEIEGLGIVFTTDDDDAKAVVKEMNLTFIKEPFFLAADQMVRYDAITGEMLENVDIKPKYKSWNNKEPKTSGGSTTSRTPSSKGASNTTDCPIKNVRKASEALLALVDSIKSESDAMSLLPDIFTDKSSINNLKIDYRKVKLVTNDEKQPFIERLQIYDMVFGYDYVGKYESFPPALREEIRYKDKIGGMKAARDLVDQMYDSKQKVMGH